MNKFWQFARQLLRHRSILAAMVGGLVLVGIGLKILAAHLGA